MLYRHKLLLALCQHFGQLTAIELQKYLFLVTRRQAKPSYDFIPHKYGCFSFLADNDTKKLTKQGLLKQSENSLSFAGETDFFLTLQPMDRKCLKEIQGNYRNLRNNDLVKEVYKEFPYFAIRSQIASSLLNDQELTVVEQCRPTDNASGIFTIGYEGISIDGFIAKLIQNGIRHLCDVRKNPFSMKFDFCKKQLIGYLNEANISYSHHPELGIESQDRKEAKQNQSWEALFRLYKETVASNEAAIAPLYTLLEQHKKIALMCFEQNPDDCHRSRLLSILSVDRVKDGQSHHL